MPALNQRKELSLRSDWPCHQIMKYLTPEATLAPPYHVPDDTGVADESLRDIAAKFVR
jgi:hypothetical protein